MIIHMGGLQRFDTQEQSASALVAHDTGRLRHAYDRKRFLQLMPVFSAFSMEVTRFHQIPRVAPVAIRAQIFV